MTRADKRELRHVTMACWWESRRTPDWIGIRGELLALMNGAFVRGDMAEFNQLARLYDIAGEQS